ncbi:STM4504/CBY_0614 family protein [Chitinophaga silvisoli]|uniref:HEPN AbiJ-N-terminal domain-containing protein n=1 Tax=Chitinophaga silvisoli TaxID=2291814 RepID=A0A3E1P411_9BACT|nr:hypothetical protein [Chitinophaga silvisoli]RFM34943.1 hypothetical protein DXN04_12020 [Chitinophaga silvisoli]
MIFDLFSKRQKRLRGEVPEIFTYDHIPDNLRVQIVHIIDDVIGAERFASNLDPDDIYSTIHGILCREYGVFRLWGKYEKEKEQLFNYILKAKLVEEVLDAVDLTFKYFLSVLKPSYLNYKHNTTSKLDPDAAIQELNVRFKENGIGYSFEGGEILRIDSTFMHKEVTQPTLSLLWNNCLLR